MKKAAWDVRSRDEIANWRSYLSERGVSQAQKSEFVSRNSSSTPLSPEVEKAVSAMQPRALTRILEVGCGPMSPMGHVAQCGAVIEITHTDALAKEYLESMAENGIAPPHSISPVLAEELLSTFPPNYFDIVFCLNALEHTINPLLSLFNMLIVLHPDGVCFLRHGWRNGEFNHYQGLHQWDLWCENSHFMIGRGEHTIDASFWLEAISDSEAWSDGSGEGRAVCARFTKQ